MEAGTAHRDADAAALAGGDEVLAGHLRRHAGEYLSGRSIAAFRAGVDRLVALSAGPCPWVRLVTALTLHDLGRQPEADRLAAAALAAFEAAGDPVGRGFVYYTWGNWAVARGDLAAASGWWRRGRPLLAGQAPAYGILTNSASLGAYAAGRPTEALTWAEEALAWGIEQRSARAEGAALLFIAFFALMAGSFARVEEAVALAEPAFGGIEDLADRFEWPGVGAVGGALWALRGSRPRAEESFAGALRAADAVDVTWIRAMALTLRAEFCARAEPRRSLADGRWARDVLVERGDRWWSGWATVATGLALGEVGERAAGARIVREVVEATANPFERARYQLLLGEQLARLEAGAPGRPAVAGLLEAAAAGLAGSGAGYWAARAEVALSGVDTVRAARLVDRARGRVGTDRADRRLFRGDVPFAVELLGAAELRVGDRPVVLPTRHARSVLLALAVAGPRGVAPLRLAGWVWPDADEATARRNLKTGLWQARRALGPAAGRLHRDRQLVRLDLDDEECDVRRVRAAAERVLRGGRWAAEVDDLLAALGRPLLGGQDHDEWVIDLQDDLDAVRDRLARLPGRPLARPPGTGTD